MAKASAPSTPSSPASRVAAPAEPGRDRMQPRGDGDGPTREKRSRLGIIINADGKLDPDSIRPQDIEALKQALAEPTIRAKLGLDAKPLQASFPAGLVVMFYGVLGSLETMLAVRGFGIDQQAASVLRYSEEEIRYLMEPTRKVADKHLGNRLSMFAEEIELGGKLIQVHLQKIQSLRTAAAVGAKTEHGVNGAARAETVTE